MGFMGKGGDKVHTRELKRMFVTESDPSVDEEKIENYTDTLKVKDDYWSVRELDSDDKVLYERRFEIDEWVEAIKHFEERSESPVVWQEDEEKELSKKYDWMGKKNK